MIFLNVFLNEASDVVNYSMYSLFQFQLWLRRSSYDFQFFKYVRCINSYDITYINIENQKNFDEMKISKKIVDEIHKLKMMQITCNSLAKNINHFFIDEKWIFMTITLIMLFWHSLIVLEDMLIVILFLLYSTLFRVSNPCTEGIGLSRG